MPAPDAEGLVTLEAPYDLVATLYRTAVWGTDPTTRFGTDEVWTAFRAKSGVVSVHYAADGARVRVRAWGPGAREAVALAPDHLGANDASWRATSDHPIVGPLLEALRPLRFGRSLRVMERLVPVIIAQKVTSMGAAESWRELLYRYGERAPVHEHLWIPPSAERLRTLAYYDLHPMNLERRRAETILFAARRAKRIEALADQAPEIAHARLVAFPGIGPWTAATVVSGALGCADAVPTGDYHMPHHVAHALLGEPRGTDAQMLELLEPFRPFRGRALSALLSGAPGVPRRGPRLSIRNIRES